MIRSRQAISEQQARLRLPFVEERIVELGAGGGRGSGGGNLLLAMITAHAGTAAPYLYSADPVEFDAAGQVVSRSSSDNLSWKLRNIAEYGPDGAGLAPISNDSVIGYWSAGGGWFAFERHNSRGTYP